MNKKHILGYKIDRAGKIIT